MPRPRPLEKRLEQVEGRRGAVAGAQSAAAARQRRLLRAESALGEIIRKAMARAGVDAADATRLALADDAAAALAAIPDTQQLWNADAAVQASPIDRARAAAFASKIIAMTRRFADGALLDFAGASFAELLAWSLAQKAGRRLSAPPDSNGATPGERRRDLISPLIKQVEQAARNNQPAKDSVPRYPCLSGATGPPPRWRRVGWGWSRCLRVG